MNRLSYYLDLSIKYQNDRSKKYFTKYLVGQSEMLKQSMEKGYILSTYYIPNEIFSLFDVPVLYGERIAGFGAACHLPMKNVPQLSPFFDDICSYQRFLEDMINTKELTLPSFIVAADYPCDSAYVFYKYISEKYNIPFYGIRIDRTCKDEELTQRCITNQLEHLYELLKEKYEQIYTETEVCNISNAALEIKMKIDQLRMEYPGIISSQEMMNIFPAINDFGRLFVVDCFKNLYQDVLHRLKDYQMTRGDKLMWLGTTPLYTHLIDEIEKRYNCTFVYEDLFDCPYVHLSEYNFFPDMSRRLMETVFFHVDSRIKSLYQVADSFQVDGIIHFLQRRCKFLPEMYQQIEQGMLSRNIPIIGLYGDGINPGSSMKAYEKDLDLFMKGLMKRDGH